MWDDYHPDTRNQSKIDSKDQGRPRNGTADDDSETREEEKECDEDGDSVVDDEEQHVICEEDWVDDSMITTKQSVHTLSKSQFQHVLNICS